MLQAVSQCAHVFLLTWTPPCLFSNVVANWQYISTHLHLLANCDATAASITTIIAIITTIDCTDHDHVHSSVVDGPCDASELLSNAETVGDCSAALPSGTSCTNTPVSGFTCVRSTSCFDGTLALGLCIGTCGTVRDRKGDYWMNAPRFTL